MQQEDIGLQHYLEVIWRRKLVIVAVFLIVLSISLIGITLTEPTYKASSLVAVKNQMYWRAPMLSFAPGTDEADTTLSGQAYEDIINGLPFAEKVADHLTRQAMPMDPAAVAGAIQAEYQEPDRIRITAISTDPDQAVALANAAAQVFVDDSKGTMMKKLTSGRESALTFQDKAAADVTAIKAEVAHFHREMGFIDINGHMENLRAKIAGFEAQRGDVITKLEIAQADRNELLRLASVSAEQNLLLDDPRIEEYRKLQQDIMNARVRYTDDHPALKNLNDQLRSIEERLKETIVRSGTNLSPEAYLTLREKLTQVEGEIADLQTAIDSWTRQIEEVKAELSNYPEKLARLQALEARARVAQDSYNHWTKNLEELEFKKAMVPGNASLVDLAIYPNPAISKSTSSILATLVALMLALGSGLLVEFADTTLRSAEELSAAGLGYLGSIIRLKEPRSLVFQDGKPTHQAAESYTRVYSNIKFAEIESPFRSILVTSARKGEGKSTTLMNLACAIAAAGKRVIVVDTDLRNPTLQRILGLRLASGVTSVLAGEKSLDEALQATVHPGLRLLPAGPIPPNPAELLHSHAMRELIRELESRADLVIFDTPPALLVADAMLLAGELDAAIIVAESGGVSRKAVQQVVESLQKAQARILGVILNKTAESPGSYYNYYSYYSVYREPEEEGEAQAAAGWIKEGFGAIRKSLGGRS
ncbi:MAG TPA: polysaccharide biosynthesis tyrosine autokinase [Candidatus Polarisedimenticolia bacterium]|nr:polysaccharide biosynthesis tyrosine autokinase [Candidatus Polarisedimenticolia bacterium]